jgi:hypothetical protein
MKKYFDPQNTSNSSNPIISFLISISPSGPKNENRSTTNSTLWFLNSFLIFFSANKILDEKMESRKAQKNNLYYETH